MLDNVKKEIELYRPMCEWLNNYLKGKYPHSDILTLDTHSRALDSYLEEYNVLNEYQQTIGLDIQIDVLGLIKQSKSTKLVFIEAKKTPLNLHDLGQLWAYCKLCDPQEAFLLSSKGLGSLNKIINNLSRFDILDFGDKKIIKKMQIAKWDISKSSIDYKTLTPKIS